MHTKLKTVYICQNCAASSPKWVGQCAACLAWNTLIEQAMAPKKSGASSSHKGRAPMVLSEIKSSLQPRFDTGCGAFNQVLGGGLVASSVVLLGGDPGIGKSTLLLQVMSSLSTHHPVLYVSGEESLQQIALRAKRAAVATDKLPVLAETQFEVVLATLRHCKAKIVVIDSIQTMSTEQLPSAPGSVAQVRYCANELVKFAKKEECTLFLVGHVTKEGTLAGPRVLEHLVDTVLYFESQNQLKYRIIRAVKNRFGPVNELAVYVMMAKGLKAITNPSAIFLNQNYQAEFGSVVTAIWEGTRPLLIELQALVDDAVPGGAPRRVVVGYDPNRVMMLLAVMNRYMGLNFQQKDVFINVVGGLKITETALDLALVFALYSSMHQKKLPKDVLVFGEVGLSGELRGIAYGQERLAEAQKQGFSRAWIPAANQVSKRVLQAKFQIEGMMAVKEIKKVVL
jgi:DNA repair protein RadA/Sms